MTVVKKATTTQLPEVITMTTGQSSTTDELSGLTNNDESTIKFSHKSSSVTIPEDADVDYLVQILPVENKPPKHDSVYCNIVGGNVQDAFVIYTNAAGNCEIRVRYPNILDRETSENHILNVTVGFPDSQSSGTVTSGMHAYDYTLLTVTLSDVNDNAPRFLYPDLESERQRTYFGVLDLHAKEFTTAVKVK
uniref:Cadherin domain-containing protein n=1 Tax=Romanomermis culicivorax TaxID=13658 RepID=A0A915HMG3_ROMCU